MKNEENPIIQLGLNNGNSLIKIRNNYKSRLVSIKNFVSPNQFSSNSRISFGKEISTGETNIYNNKKEKIKIKKNVNPLKEEKYKYNIDVNCFEKLPIKISKQVFLKKCKTKTVGYFNENFKLEDTKEKFQNKLYINYSKDNFDNKDNLSLDTNREMKSNKINADKKNKNQIEIQCLFCGKICKDANYFKNFKCQHYFCKECGKNFYQNLIKKDDKKFFKCPVFSCLCVYSNQFITSLNSLKLNEFQNNYKINYLERKNSTHELNSNEYFISNDNSMKKNIMEINNQNNFYLYIKRFLLECPICKDTSLYGNIKAPYYKCLKCLKSFCKYCREEYNYSHFDLSCKEHCKVFYRMKKKKYKKKFNIIFFLKFLVIFIFAYLYIMTFFINKLKESFKIKNFGKRIIYIIIFIILSIVFTSLSILLIPYFPIICTI